MLLFIFTLGAGLVGQLSFGKSAPLNAAVPMVSGAGSLAAATAAPATMLPAMPALATVAPVVSASATAAPVTSVTLGGASNTPAAATPTEATSVMAVEQATPPAVVRAVQSPSAPQAHHRPVNFWLFIWPGMAVLLGASAIVAWGLNKRAFQRKNPRG